MSTYPGENPQTPDGEQPANSTDETQPVGYWERQAVEQAQGKSQQAAPREAPGPNPYTEMPGVSPYGPSAPGSPGYDSQDYGSQGYDSQDYGSQPGLYPPQPGQPVPYQYPPAPGGGPGAYGLAPVAPAHPQSTLALVLGLVGLAGLFVCGLPLLVSPFAWAIGRSSLKGIRESQGRLSGESNARAGMIMGIIGTVLLILVVLAIIAFVGLLSVGSSSSSFEGTTV